MTHQNVDPWSDGTQRQTSPTSRPTSHNASSGRAQSTFIDVIDTCEATSHKATFGSRRALAASYAFATHSTVSPRAADGCIARMMRKPNGARLTSDAAL